jgi:septal ring factor EnvC (AmiA/AmiB activator)
MAQWRGQFSGYTHGTLVEDYEESLREMVSACKALRSKEERTKRLPALLAAAQRVHHARVKRLSARLAAARSSVLHAEDRPAHGREATSLERRLAALQQARPETILAEFGMKSH